MMLPDYSPVTGPIRGAIEDDSAVDPMPEDEAETRDDHDVATAGFASLGSRPDFDLQGYRIAESASAPGREAASEF